MGYYDRFIEQQLTAPFMQHTEELLRRSRLHGRSA
jgi:hypothetical protein